MSTDNHCFRYALLLVSLFRSTFTYWAEVLFYRGKDLVSCLYPLERFRIFVPTRCPNIDGFNQLLLGLVR